MKVNLNEVEEAIDNASDDIKAYYYIPEERIVYENEIDAGKEQKNLIALPDRHEVDDYGNMESFIAGVKDDTAKQWLTNAIHGRGAFRMFRAACQRFNLLNDWYDYQQMCHRTLAEEWCDANGILYEEESADEEYSGEEDGLAEVTAPEASVKAAVNVRIVPLTGRNYMSALEPAAVYLDWKNHTHANDFEKAGTFLEEKLSERYRIYCSAVNGRYTGIAILNVQGWNEAVLEGIFVLNGFQNKGIGTRMITEMQKQMASEEKQLLIRIPCGSQESLSFFKKAGYEPSYLELSEKK